MKLPFLDGEKLYHAFIHGRNKILTHQSHLNKINVFPVPDGDTGTNLASTVNAMVEGTEEETSVSSVSSHFAEKALIGSRGNAGIIFAQFLNGLSEALHGKEKINPREFAKAMQHAVDHAYKAMSKPVEGTILTVMKAWANALQGVHEKTSDIGEMIHHSLHAARLKLQETPKMLKILEKAGVVDAGGQGFVHFMEGVSAFLKHGKKARKIPFVAGLGSDDHLHREVIDGKIDFRYCTEALIQGDDLDPDVIQSYIQEQGDSLITAGTQEKMRVHMHTNHPSVLLKKLRVFGTIVQQKVDDMKHQYNVHYHQKSKIALVTDSSCDLPQHFLDEHQIHVVPLQITFGDQQYIDKLTLQPDQFYTMLQEEPEFPKTSQPSVKAFENVYSFLSSYYDSIISIHLSSPLSGTFNAAQQAARKIKDKVITVIDSKNLSISLALIVQELARGMNQYSTHNDMVQKTKSLIKKVDVLVSVKTLNNLVRGGRISPLKGKLANLLNLKPIVTLDLDGNIVLHGKAFSNKANFKKVIKMVEQRHRRHPVQNYIIGTAGNKDEALKLETKLQKIIGKNADYILSVSPAIGAHVGIGAFGVSMI